MGDNVNYSTLSTIDDETLINTNQISTTIDGKAADAIAMNTTNTTTKDNTIECTDCGNNINIDKLESIQNDNIKNNTKTTTSNLLVEIDNDHDNDVIGNPIDKRFSEWIHCMCVVTFDLELGQAMEEVYPKNTILSEQEIMNVCYLAFPDSNSSCMGDTQYHVRLRLSSDNIDSFPLNPIHGKFNAQCIPEQRPDLAHYWGFVYFRQKKDKTIPRGYFQKSFIILTRLPFFNLFNEIVSAIAPRYFNDGKKILEIVYDQINNWPTLKAGESYTLNLLGTVYQTIIPKSNSKSHNSYKSNSSKSNNLTKLLSSTSKIEIDTNNDKLNLQINQTNDINTLINNDDDYKKQKYLCKNCKYNDEQKQQKQQIRTEFVGPTLPPQVLISVHEIDIFRSLSIYISNIYTLWELVLIAEPIVIMGSSPADCSHMVQSLISLIYPLCYLAESRPYFTIHDSEFREFTSPSTNFSDINVNNGSSIGSGSNTNQTTANNSNLIPPSIILGVTNPFFAKLLQNWPNMIKLPDNSQQIYSIIPKFSFGYNSSNSNNLINNETININDINNYDYYNNITTNPSIIKMKNSEFISNHNTIGCSSNSNSNNYNNNSNNSNLINYVTGNYIIDGNNSPGLYSKYKPFLKKDKTLIKKIQLGIKTKRPEQVQSALLRKHFLELTQSFIIPLERYMASLLPLKKDISPFKAAPNPNEFKQDEFLSTLEQSGPQLTSSLKGNWKGLYKRFFKSPNFKGWYETRYKELKQTLQELQLQALSDADLNQWAQGKQEVEIIDMILKLKQKLKLCSESQLITDDVLKSPTRIQLLKQIDNITESLPDDLKIIIQKST